MGPLERIEFARQPPLAVIAFNRPEVRNALDRRTHLEVIRMLAEVEQDDEVRAVVLRGNGPGFSSGFDFSSQVAEVNVSPQIRRTRARSEMEFILSIWSVSKPVVAAVHGFCIGLALDVMLACDLVVAAESCRFGEPEVKNADKSSVLLLPWVIGLRRAKQLILTGDIITAREAGQLGLVNWVVPDAECFPEAERVARKIARLPREVIRLSKESLNHVQEIMGLHQSIRYNLETFVLAKLVDAPERTEFRRIMKDSGIRAALKWREEYFAEEK